MSAESSGTKKSLFKPGAPSFAASAPSFVASAPSFEPQQNPPLSQPAPGYEAGAYYPPKQAFPAPYPNLVQQPFVHQSYPQAPYFAPSMPFGVQPTNFNNFYNPGPTHVAAPSQPYHMAPPAYAPQGAVFTPATTAPPAQQPKISSKPLSASGITFTPSAVPFTPQAPSFTPKAEVAPSSSTPAASSSQSTATTEATAPAVAAPTAAAAATAAAAEADESVDSTPALRINTDAPLETGAEPSNIEPEGIVEDDEDDGTGGNMPSDKEESEDEADEGEDEGEEAEPEPEIAPLPKSTKFTREEMLEIAQKYAIICNRKPNMLAASHQITSSKNYLTSNRPHRPTNSSKLPSPRGRHGAATPRGERDRERDPRRSQNNAADGPSLGPRVKVHKATGAEAAISRELTSLINKITPENFERIVTKIKMLEIKTKTLLQQVVNLITFKAIKEPFFAPTYARMCEEIVKHWDSQGDENSPTKEFKRQLLNTMQTYFQAKPPPITGVSTEVSKDEMDALNKERVLGTVKFVGELYIRRVIYINIVRDCINMLIAPAPNSELPNLESLESLIKLLTTIGSTMDQKVQVKNQPEPSRKNIEFLNMIFERLQVISQNAALETRIRMLLQNLIDLRRNGWKSRKDDPNAARSAPKSDYRPAASGSQDARRTIGPMDRYEKLGAPSPSPKTQSQDEWSAAKTGAKRGKAVQQKLFPGPRVVVAASAPLQLAQGFAALNTGDDDTSATADSAHTPSFPPSTPASSASAAPEMSREDAESKVRALFVEYLNTGLFSETELRVGELPRAHRYLIVALGPYWFIEQKGSPIEKLAPLVVQLADKDLLTVAEIDAGLQRFFESFEDYLPDMPHLINDTANMLAQLIAAGLAELNTLFTPSNMAPLMQDESPSAKQLLIQTLLKLTQTLPAKIDSLLSDALKHPDTPWKADLILTDPKADTESAVSKHPELKPVFTRLFP